MLAEEGRDCGGPHGACNAERCCKASPPGVAGTAIGARGSEEFRRTWRCDGQSQRDHEVVVAVLAEDGWKSFTVPNGSTR